MYDVLPLCDLNTQDFGCTTNSKEWYAPNLCPQQRYFHAGIDLSKTGGSCGQLVKATREGVVAAIGIHNRAALGDRAVRLDVADGFSILYGHLEVAAVNVGATLKIGDIVGQVGTRGASSGCHLHFEVRTTASVATGQLNGVIDPDAYLMNSTVGGETLTSQEVAAVAVGDYYSIGVNAFPLAGEAASAYQARIGNDLDNQVRAVLNGTISLHDMTNNILKTHPH